jgi:hypothetical protein
VASANIEVGYRPLRVGFLAREGSLDDLLAVARLNTMVWGGVTNPIIPVGDDVAAAEGLVEQFAVDVLHPVVDDPRLNEVVERFPHLRQPREISMHGLFDLVGDDEIGLVTIRVLAGHYYGSAREAIRSRCPHFLTRSMRGRPSATWMTGSGRSLFTVLWCGLREAGARWPTLRMTAGATRRWSSRFRRIPARAATSTTSGIRTS